MNKYELKKSAVTLAVGAALAGGSAQAATITVTSNTDAPLGTFPTVCTLRAAIASANTASAVDGCAAGSSGEDSIEFDLEESTITLAAGDIEITGPLTIEGKYDKPFRSVTIDANNSSRIFRIIGTEPGAFTVNLRSLSLINGQPGDGQSGGAIYADHANLHLYATLISNNSATGSNVSGGGLSVHHGDLSLDHSVISDNSIAGPGSRGIGLYVDSGTLSMISTTVSDNLIPSGYGGAGAGAGIYIRDGEAIITESTISGNTARSLGGGIKAYNSALSLEKSTVSSNEARLRGGGIKLRQGNLLLSKSTVSDNLAVDEYTSRGGGIFSADANVVITNSTISGNQATGTESLSGPGGLAFLTGEEGYALILTHTTVAYNTGLDYDGLLVSPAATFILNNSMVVQDAGRGCNPGADAVSSNSLSTDYLCTGTATPLEDIALEALADNGGPTLTHALKLESVAINAAGNCLSQFGIDVDQRGEPRPGSGQPACDIGAYELQVIDQIFQDRFEQ